MPPFHHVTHHGLALMLLGVLPATAIAQTTEAPRPLKTQAFKDCLEALLYDTNFAPKQRTDIPDFVAARVCQQQPVNPSATARQLQDCMEDLMYDHDFAPKQRTDVSRFTAARVCAEVE